MKRIYLLIVIVMIGFSFSCKRDAEKLQSRDYEGSELKSYILIKNETTDDFATLLTDGVPSTVVDDLRPLQGLRYGLESTFNQVLIDSIGKSNFSSYGTKIKEVAYKLATAETFDSIPSTLKLYDIYRYLNLSNEECRVLYDADKANLMHIRRVMIPEGDCDVDSNVYVTDPVGEMVGDVMVVTAIRKFGKTAYNQSSGKFFVISKDHGKTWSSNIYPFYDYCQNGYVLETKGTNGQLLSSPSFGKFTTTDGVERMIIRDHGAFISGDFTSTDSLDWFQTRGSELRQRQLSFGSLSKSAASAGDVSNSAYATIGPKIIYNPYYGLMFFSTTTSNAVCGTIFRSKDNGLTWEDKDWLLQTSITTTTEKSLMLGTEPSAMTFPEGLANTGNIVLLFKKDNTVNMYVHRFSTDKIPADGTFADISNLEFTLCTTNLAGPGKYYSNLPDVSYNPITDRVDVIESTTYYLRLWDIDPNILFPVNGLSTTDTHIPDITFSPKAILLERNDTGGNLTGMRATSVIDEANSMQHIFFYAGTGTSKVFSRNGIYMLSRTLDTDKLYNWSETTRAKYNIDTW